MPPEEARTSSPRVPAQAAKTTLAMLAAATWVVALGHNGVDHPPGESSAVMVGPVLDPSFCENTNCFSIYNYGQNYLKICDGGTITEHAWHIEYMPIAAAAVRPFCSMHARPFKKDHTFLLVHTGTHAALHR